MATLQNTTVNTTGFLTVPVGTVAQRPGVPGGPNQAITPAQGMIRLCTDFPGFDSPVLEYYDGSDWKSLYTPVATGQGGTETTVGGFNYHTYTTVGNSTFTVVAE